ncbi:hypothetical protein AB0I60_27430 [Actinosynnema sp. NPDC050436]|uniref:hypothetical protein n=1 Tax=Actinosynnema sp. NPDC050436 TaxID=3155659 RepID=UPI0033FA90EF
MDVQRLLWDLADKYAPAARASYRRPERFDHAGGLVVAEGRVKWETPWCTEGGFSHALPAGSHPVYAGSFVGTPDDRDPDGIRHVVGMIVIPLVEPARIAAAKWDDDGYDDIHLIEGYAVLWGGEARRTALPFSDERSTFFAGVRERSTPGPVGDWVEAVLDRETGANAFVFPVDAENVDGFEIVDDGGTLLCLVLTAYS